MTLLRNLPRSLALIIMLMLLGGALDAQVAFRTTAVDVKPEGLNYFFNKQDTPVLVSQDLKSFPFTLTGSGPLFLYTLQKSPEGKTVTNPVASVDLSAAGTLPLLMFFKGTSPSQPYRIVTLKEDAVSFPGSACRFANFSQLGVDVSFGGTSFYLPPNNVVEKMHKGNTALVTISSPNQTGKTLPMISHNMLLESDKRYLFLILSDPKSSSGIALKMLTDRVPR